MRLWSSHPPAERWLSRSRLSFPPLGEPLGSLVPEAAEVPYDQVEHTLVGQYLASYPLWGGIEDSLWSQLWLARSEARCRIEEAIHDGQLSLRLVVLPTQLGLLTRLRDRLHFHTSPHTVKEQQT